MAGKKNVVGRAKGSAVLALGGILCGGWLLAGFVMVTGNEARKQESLIRSADILLEDELYVRAAGVYTTALRTYSTEQNPVYEEKLLDIYRTGGMMEEYYGLIEDRMEKGAAKPEEYMALASYYVDGEAVNRAIPVLKDGISRYGSEDMIALYESVSYAYAPASTNYTEVKMPSSDWYIPAFDGEHWGYIGDNGKTRLPFLYEEATSFSGNYAVVKQDGQYLLIDKNGYRNAVDKNGLEEVTAISGSRIIGKKDGRYRIYTNTFTPLGEETYEAASFGGNGMAAVKKDGKWAFLDEKLEAVTEYAFTDVAVNSRGEVFSGGYAAVSDVSGYFLINEKGEACFEARFAGAKGMEGGLAAMADASGNWGFVNEKGEVLVDFLYQDVYSFSDRLAAVKYAGKWGYLNRYGTMMIEPQFETAFPFHEGRALVTDDMGRYKVLELKYFDLF